jgi:hypothetical protein
LPLSAADGPVDGGEYALAGDQADRLDCPIVQPDQGLKGLGQQVVGSIQHV